MQNTLLVLLIVALIWSASFTVLGVWAFHLWRSNRQPIDYMIMTLFTGSGLVVFGLSLWKLSVVLEHL